MVLHLLVYFYEQPTSAGGGGSSRRCIAVHADRSGNGATRGLACCKNYPRVAGVVQEKEKMGTGRRIWTVNNGNRR